MKHYNERQPQQPIETDNPDHDTEYIINNEIPSKKTKLDNLQ